jgi:hypothetical protein
LTFLPPLRRICLACTKSTRRCVCAINSIQNGFTARTRAKDAVSRASPNTSPYVSNLAPLCNFPPTHYLFRRLVQSFQRTRRLVDQVETICRARLASARLWTNWWMMRRHGTTQNASLMISKPHALRKVVERLQHGRLPENPSGNEEPIR